MSPLRPDSTIARPGGFTGNERKVAESSGNGYSYSMVLDRVQMTTDVSDVDTPWIVNYPQVESAGGAHHGVELVQDGVTVLVSKPTLVAEPLHGWLTFIRALGKIQKGHRRALKFMD